MMRTMISWRAVSAGASHTEKTKNTISICREKLQSSAGSVKDCALKNERGCGANDLKKRGGVFFFFCVVYRRVPSLSTCPFSFLAGSVFGDCLLSKCHTEC